MKLLKLLIVALSVMFFSVAATAGDKTKVGFIYVGPTGDHGWTIDRVVFLVPKRSQAEALSRFVFDPARIPANMVDDINWDKAPLKGSTFIDVVDEVKSHANFNAAGYTKTRVGKLSGIGSTIYMNLTIQTTTF